MTVFLNTGERDGGGLPVFVKDAEIPAPVAQNSGICAVDLDGDGAPDLVVNGHYIRNLNPEGWPFEPAEPVDLGIGKRLTFIDLDGDGLLDAMGMSVGVCEHRPTWRRNLGGDPPAFGAEEPLPGVDLDSCSEVRSARDGGRTGFLVQHNMYQNPSETVRRTSKFISN